MIGLVADTMCIKSGGVQKKVRFPKRGRHPAQVVVGPDYHHLAIWDGFNDSCCPRMCEVVYLLAWRRVCIVDLLCHHRPASTRMPNVVVSNPKHEAGHHRYPPKPLVFETVHIATLKKTLCGMRNHCSFMHVCLAEDGVHWVGTSGIDNLHLHVRMPCSMFRRFCNGTEEEDTGGGARVVCEINLLRLYQIIKRASMYRYESVRFTITPTHNTVTGIDSAAVLLLFATCNKRDTHHMRACVTTCDPMSPGQGAVCELPLPTHAHPHYSVPTELLCDALSRFDPETFHSVSIRPVPSADGHVPATSAAVAAGAPGAVVISPHSDTTLTIRSRSDGMSGKVRLPAVHMRPVPPHHQVPATEAPSDTTAPLRSQTKHSRQRGSRYNLASVQTSAQFARMSKKGHVHITHQRNSLSEVSPPLLKFQFELRHGCSAVVLIPPVTHSVWTLAGAESSSSSDSDSA